MMLATCPDETDLLAVANGEPPGDAINAHIESCDACRRQVAELRGSLDELRQVRESFDLFRPTRRQPDAPPPAQVGKYKVLDVLDRGGQAWVFRVLHPTIRKEMVLKLSRHPLLPDQAESGRLVTEARVLAELDHPAIAHVYDLDFCTESPFDRHPYIVMEWVPGRTLFQYARDHPVGWREAALLVAQVARAAAVAHRRGITHRDISHRNILIDENRRPRLIDFGLARIGSVWADTHEPAGTIAGTPDFMAPEQAESRLDEIGPRTDVYALGAVLRWVISATPAETAATTVTVPPLDSAPDATQTKPAIEGRAPDAIARIISKAMQRAPADRYQSADELAAELERAATPRSRKWPVAMAAAGIAVAAMLALALWPRPAPPIPPLADVLHVNDRNPLTSYLPLASSVNVYFSVEVPRGAVPVAVWVDPDGSVELARPGLTRTPSDDSRFDRWECWRDTRVHVSPNDPSGTKFVLVCARKKAMSDADVTVLVDNLKQFAGQGWLPDLPPRQLVRVGSMQYGVQAEVSRGFEAAPVQGRSAVQRLGELRQHLLDAGYTFFEGEAFPYVQAGPTSAPAAGK